MSLLDQLDLGSSAPPAPSGAVALSSATFAALRQFVYDRTGIYFRDNKRYLLESRLGRRVEALGLPDFEAYLRHLQAHGARELSELINAITINETFFFRHADQHRLFVREILPELVEHRLARGQRRVRLWSAACSTGDEPYTLALLIREELQPRYPHVTFEIVGTDIDTQVLAKARTAVYEPYAVRAIPADLRRRYFREEAGPHGPRYHLDARIRAMVRFEPLNLIDRAAGRRLTDFDAAFCANVLIYFDEASKQTAASVLYGALRPGGYLFVGVSETLYGVTQAFQPVRFAQAVAYLKPETAGAGTSALTGGVAVASTPAPSPTPAPSSSRVSRYA